MIKKRTSILDKLGATKQTVTPQEYVSKFTEPTRTIASEISAQTPSVAKTSILEKIKEVTPVQTKTELPAYSLTGSIKTATEYKPQVNETAQGLNLYKAQLQFDKNYGGIKDLTKEQVANDVKTKFNIDLTDESIGGRLKKSAAELKLNADQRKEYGQLLQDYIQLGALEKPVAAGIAQGAQLQDLYSNIREKAPVSTTEMQSSLPYKAGEVAGNLGKYAGLYTLLGPAIAGGGSGAVAGGIGGATGTLTPTLTQQLGYTLGAGTAGTFATELAKDVVLGAGTGAIEAALQGGDVTEAVGKSIAQDIVFNAVLGVGGKIAGGVADIWKTLDKPSIIEQVVKQANVTPSEAVKLIDDQIETVANTRMQSDAVGVNLKQPNKNQQDVYLHSTNKQFENFKPSNDGLVYFSKDNKTGKTIADLILAKNENLHPNAPKYRMIKSTFDTDKVKIFDPFDDENAKKIAQEFGLPTDRSTVKWDEISSDFTERIKKDGYNVVQILEPNGNTSYAVADTSIIKQIPQPTIDRPSEFTVKPMKLSERVRQSETKPITMAESVRPQETISMAESAPMTADQLIGRERGFSENIRTDVNRVDELRKELDSNPAFYDVLSNKTTLESAQERFSKGYEEALKDFDSTKTQLRADNVPFAKMIADEAARRGDMQTARRVIVDVAENLTTAGQYSQAAKILRESNDPVTILNFVQKEINNLNTKGGTRYGKKWNRIDLTDDELGMIAKIGTNATDEQKEKLFEELFNSISTRIPTTNREKFDTWRRIAMLFNPKTHIRNVVGNTLMTGVKKVSDTIAKGLELPLKPELRTKGSVTKELKTVANDYFSKNAEQLMEGSRWEIFGVKSPFADKKIFKTGWLNTLDDVSKNTLEKEDLFFFKKNFTDDLASFMNTRGLKEPTQEAIDYASRRAQEATFRQANKIAEAINKLKGSRMGLIVDAAVPFTKTPANILQTGVDYSPIGLVKGAVSLITNENPAKAIETFSKGLTGSGLAMLGYYMGMNGLARGEYDTSKKVEGLYQATGNLPNSIKTPKGSYTVDWAQPLSIPFFMGVAFAESLKEQGDDKVQAGFDALVAGGETLVNQSMLSGIKDLFGGYGTMTEKVIQLPINYMTQGFPTVAGQIARVIDPTKRQLDYSSIINSTLTSLQSKTPGASLSLPAKRNILGESQQYGKGLLNAFQQFLSPGYIGEKSDNPVVNEIDRLYNEVGSDFLPRYNVTNFTSEKVKYKLTNEEISELQRIMGEYTNKQLSQMIESSDYRYASDEQKAEMIKNVNDIGYKLAKEVIVKSRSK